MFFSRITLEDKIGTEYEPYIYAALASSKVMITVSSSKENIEAVWVKNEWSRFLSFMAKDSSKSIIPLYYDMPKTDLPDEFAHLTAYDMHENGFEQELIRGIKKLIPTPVVLKERRKKRNKILKRVGIAAIACLIVGVICAVPWLLKLPDYNAAMQLYYDKNYPEAAWAFGSLGDYRNCAEMKKKCELSWRKSLANVIIETLDGAKGDGIYYIDNNGSVQRVGVSRLNMKLDIGQHGKVVSLAPNNKTNVIYEDGFVSNISNSVQNKEKWNDIIMMSDYFDDTTIALRADGTMIYDVIDDNKKHKGNSSSYGNSNEWMKPISKWKNIVAFCAEKLCGNGYTYDSAIITGLKSDGTVESVKYKNPTHSNSCIICRKNEYNVSEFKNVKYINNNVAINKTGEVLSYINGKFNKREFKNAVEVYTEGNQIYVLNNEGNIVDLYSNSVVSKDIVHKSDWYYVSRNGNVHVYDEIVDSVKVPVYKEWTERMR